MNKILLIIKREYITRVRNKTFLLSTFLLPLLMFGLIFGGAMISANSNEKRKIAVDDQSELYKTSFKNNSSVEFEYPAGITRSNYKEKGFEGLLVIYSANKQKADSIRLFSEKQLGFVTDEAIKNQIQKINENMLLMERGVNRSILDSIRSKSESSDFLNYRSYQVKGDEIKEDNKILAVAIGYVCGFIIYIIMIIYGQAVMRGVMEEKTNRIAEVIVSSVKPFQLMLGKIIGIAAVGLTQLFLWIILIFALSSLSSIFISSDLLQHAQQVNQTMPNMAENGSMATKAIEIKNIVFSANWLLIVSLFVFYFLFGYLFYASLFAAVGSVINEDPQEAQSLALPITMPIIFALFIMMNAIQNPSGSMAVWGSIIPFTSPVVMMGRIPFGVPETVEWWQLALSMISLVGGFLLTTWLSGKIYRTGILLYGKKVTFKEMMKWAFKKA
ncbi:MAG: ABC transporter permease [Lacibacter sp.]